MKCEKHQDKDALGFCVECGRGVCEDCIDKFNSKTYCKECIKKLKSENNNTVDIVNSSYLVCEKCGILYEFKEGESLEEFENCKCGGTLKPFNDPKKGLEPKNSNPKYEEDIITVFAEIKENINLKAIFVGTIVVLVLSIIFSILIMKDNFYLLNLFTLKHIAENSYAPFAFVGVLVAAYIAGRNPKLGILNGIITSFVATIVSLFFFIFILSISFSSNSLLALNYILQWAMFANEPYFSIIFSTITIINLILVGSLAGFLGAYLKQRDPSKTRIRVKWKPTIIVIIISIVLTFFFMVIDPGWIDLLAILIPTIYVGYHIGRNYDNGIFLGSLIGIVVYALIFTVSAILRGNLYGVSVATFTLLTGADFVIISGITGGIGGLIGVFLKTSITKLPK